MESTRRAMLDRSLREATAPWTNADIISATTDWKRDGCSCDSSLRKGARYTAMAAVVVVGGLAPCTSAFMAPDTTERTLYGSISPLRRNEFQYVAMVAKSNGEAFIALTVLRIASKDMVSRRRSSSASCCECGTTSTGANPAAFLLRVALSHGTEPQW
ncbi:hypothetical protein BKA81DRAFT_368992 [Phyllosticta paracitricarpa]